MRTFTALFFFASALAIAQAYSGIAFMEDLRDRPDGRIIQGSPAVNGQFPHQAFLLVSQSSGGRSACGGSLISPEWVITAGHCVKGFVSAVVHLGDVAYSSSPVKADSSSLTPHPNYNTNNLNNDVGLIGLRQAVQTGPNIQPISIPNDVSQTYEGQIATVSGFGLTSDGGSVSPTLNYVDLKIISNSECADYFGNAVIITSTICGEGVNRPSEGTCNGDSGGPLILDNKLIGVVSFGSSAGCSASYPSGFVRPYHFLSWIKQVSGLDFS